jgi:flagellar hook protein FlgE
MMRGMYAAISGLQAHQTMLDVTANNLANVSTIGYKGQRTTFVDELSQVIRGASGPTSNNGGTNPMEVGLGVQVGSIDNMMGAGSAESTGNPLDLEVQGRGFFRVANSTSVDASGNPVITNPTPEYTRAGNFTTNTLGYLTTQSGQYVLGYKATPPVAPSTNYTIDTANGPDNAIQIPTDGTDIAVGQDGSVTFVDPADGSRKTAGYISLASFPNEAGLQREGGSLWQSTANSGAATVGSPGVGGFGTTISGELEMSNVDIATEFTNMITAERGFQANSRVITTADQMLQTLVGMGQ